MWEIDTRMFMLGPQTDLKSLPEYLKMLDLRWLSYQHSEPKETRPKPMLPTHKAEKGTWRSCYTPPLHQIIDPITPVMTEVGMQQCDIDTGNGE